MKLNRLETHDRLKHFVKDQAQTIWQGVDDCLKKNPDSLKYQDYSSYIYIFAHPRTHNDGVTKRLLWQPRLTKPRAQTNSYLFRATSHSDIVEVMWMLPPEEMWPQYQKGNVTEEPTVLWSIYQYTNKRKELEAPEPDDLNDQQAENILIKVLTDSIREKTKQAIWGASLNAKGSSEPFPQ